MTTSTTLLPLPTARIPACRKSTNLYKRHLQHAMPTKCRIEYSKGQFGFFLKGIFYFLKMEKKKKIIKINKYKKKNHKIWQHKFLSIVSCIQAAFSKRWRIVCCVWTWRLLNWQEPKNNVHLIIWYLKCLLDLPLLIEKKNQLFIFRNKNSTIIFKTDKINFTNCLC